VYNRVPISAIERSPEPFQHFFIDCAGKLLPHLNIDYNYSLIAVCSFSRFPFAIPMRSLTAKNVCDALLSILAITGLSSNVTLLSSDNGSDFSAALTRECMSRIGVSPRYITPLHPNANGLAERSPMLVQVWRDVQCTKYNVRVEEVWVSNKWLAGWPQITHDSGQNTYLLYFGLY